MTPYYADDLVTIYHGDARDVMPKSAGRGILEPDALITDPPYGIRYSSKTFGRIEGDLDFSTAEDVLSRWHGDVVVVFANDESLAQTLAIVKAEYRRLAVGVWHKSNVNGSAHGGLWWSDTEFYVAGMRRVPRIARSSLASAPKNTGNPAWQKGNVEAYQHPTQKPTSVMRHIIGSFPGIDTIIDPFMGSGSTLVAAKSLGVRAIGIEIDERYCERAALRCSQEVLGLVG